MEISGMGDLSLGNFGRDGELYTFGEFTLDVEDRRLTRQFVPISLPPKAFDLAVVLVRHAGRLVTKAQLLTAVWPEAFVEEGILAVYVSYLRKAFGDDKRAPRYIETVSRFGYRFVAPVTVRTGERAVRDGPPGRGEERTTADADGKDSTEPDRLAAGGGSWM